VNKPPTRPSCTTGLAETFLGRSSPKILNARAGTPNGHETLGLIKGHTSLTSAPMTRCFANCSTKSGKDTNTTKAAHGSAKCRKEATKERISCHSMPNAAANTKSCPSARHAHSGPSLPGCSAAAPAAAAAAATEGRALSTWKSMYTLTDKRTKCRDLRRTLGCAAHMTTRRRARRQQRMKLERGPIESACRCNLLVLRQPADGPRSVSSLLSPENALTSTLAARSALGNVPSNRHSCRQSH